MSLSDHIVLWMRNNAMPALKTDQYVWTGKNGKIGRVRNHRSITSREFLEITEDARKEMNDKLQALVLEPCGLLRLLSEKVDDQRPFRAMICSQGRERRPN
jgi:hypothetical protein